MNVIGKLIVFVKEIGKDKIKIFETSFNHKDEDGNYIDSVTVQVAFSKEILSDAQKTHFKTGYAYPLEIIEGFVTTRGYENRSGFRKSELMIMIQKCKCDWAGAKEIKIKEKPAPREDSETICGDDGEPLPLQ